MKENSWRNEELAVLGEFLYCTASVSTRVRKREREGERERERESGGEREREWCEQRRMDWKHVDSTLLTTSNDKSLIFTYTLN